MSEQIDLINIKTRSYRFSGWKPVRDRNNNIICKQKKVNQPEYWKTRAITRPKKS